MTNIFNHQLRQVILLAVIVLLGILLFSTLFIFLPGILGSITIFILTRKWYFALTNKRKWNRGLTSLLFILSFVVLIAIPVYFSVLIVSPKITLLLNNQEEGIKTLEIFSKKIETFTGMELFTHANAASSVKNLVSYLPSFLNSTVNILANLLLMFFLLYYLLWRGKTIERYLGHIIPLKPQNVQKLAIETETMIRANALGIPLICLVQGVFAAIGYLIFGLKDWGLWGFVTGVLAFFPLIGTMVVWVPLVIYMYSVNQNISATGLMLYSIIVTGNVDYLSRLGLLKKIGNVHPLVTVFGVIVGLKLFGFIGLIFGPLLISYFMILIKIYIDEFASRKPISTISV